jgi:hypothetical protein
MNGWGATRFRKGLRASEDDAAMHSHANKRSVELKYVKLRNFFDARALQQTNSTKCGPVHIQHSERGLRYLRVQEYHDWKVSPALCVYPEPTLPIEQLSAIRNWLLRLGRSQLRHLSWKTARAILAS